MLNLSWIFQAEVLNLPRGMPQATRFLVVDHVAICQWHMATWLTTAADSFTGEINVSILLYDTSSLFHVYKTT